MGTSSGRTWEISLKALITKGLRIMVYDKVYEKRTFQPFFPLSHLAKIFKIFKISISSVAGRSLEAV